MAETPEARAEAKAADRIEARVAAKAAVVAETVRAGASTVVGNKAEVNKVAGSDALARAQIIGV